MKRKPPTGHNPEEAGAFRKALAEAVEVTAESVDSIFGPGLSDEDLFQSLLTDGTIEPATLRRLIRQLKIGEGRRGTVAFDLTGVAERFLQGLRDHRELKDYAHQGPGFPSETLSQLTDHLNEAHRLMHLLSNGEQDLIAYDLGHLSIEDDVVDGEPSGSDLLWGGWRFDLSVMAHSIAIAIDRVSGPDTQSGRPKTPQAMEIDATIGELLAIFTREVGRPTFTRNRSEGSDGHRGPQPESPAAVFLCTFYQALDRSISVAMIERAASKAKPRRRATSKAKPRR